MNIRLDIEYDGSKYDGWQKNKNAKTTIQDKLDETLSKYLDQNIKVIGAGRTDKGVHAKGMVANFHVTTEIDPRVLKKDMNHYLPADIYVKDAVQVDDRFHARFGASSKIYTYRLGKTYEGAKHVFERPYTTEQEAPLNVKLMKKACQSFIGKHDFKGFSSDKTKKSTIREIFGIEIVESESEIDFIFEGNGFLYHMIRIMVGTLIEIGEGRRNISSIEKVFKSGIRANAGFLAPAKGLVLTEVKYKGVLE